MRTISRTSRSVPATTGESERVTTIVPKRRLDRSATYRGIDVIRRWAVPRGPAVTYVGGPFPFPPTGGETLMSRLALLMTLVAVTNGCTRTVDVAATRAALQDADRAFDRATSERRLEGWVESFAEDGAMLRPGGAVTGRAAIREHMSPVLGDSSFTLRWNPTRRSEERRVGKEGRSWWWPGQWK